jgi:hypothetical protein
MRQARGGLACMARLLHARRVRNRPETHVELLICDRRRAPLALSVAYFGAAVTPPEPATQGAAHH